MNHDDAIAFLVQHQPLPPDRSLREDTIRTFDEIRRWLKNNPDESVLALVLNAFGDGTGHGVYQLIEDSLGAFEPSVVKGQLKSSLASAHSSVRYWSAHIAALYTDDELVQPLANLLRDPDPDARFAAAVALDRNGSQAALTELTDATRVPQPKEIGELIATLLSRR